MSKTRRNIIFVIVIYGALVEFLVIGNLLSSRTSFILLSLGVLATVLPVINKPEKEADNKPNPDDIIENHKDQELKDTKECPVCHTENIRNIKYCKKCNTNIQDIKCPVCETKNAFDSQFCSNCDSILRNKSRH